MSLLSLRPWWARRHDPQPARDSADELERKLNAHMRNLRALTSELEAEITQIRAEGQ